jgi:hypothetical protein
MAGPHRIDLCIDLRPGDPRPDWPIVTLLIDGEDRLATAGKRGFAGFDPEEILGAERPLIPATPPRRVAVYSCSCGEPGCGVVAPVISEQAGLVHWSDFQDFTGWFEGPLDADEPEDGRPLDVQDLVFDARQYKGEIERAMSDRSWETPTRQTMRLFGEYLDEEAQTLDSLGLTRGNIRPEPWPLARFFNVSLHTEGGHRSEVEFAPGPGSPSERAKRMTEALLESPPGQWSFVFSCCPDNPLHQPR